MKQKSHNLMNWTSKIPQLVSYLFTNDDKEKPKVQWWSCCSCVTKKGKKKKKKPTIIEKEYLYVTPQNSKPNVNFDDKIIIIMM